MTEEQIDDLSIKLFLYTLKIWKWIVLQYIPLLLMPFVWDGIDLTGFFLIGLYTVLYILYWSLLDKSKRLQYLYWPYLLYVVISLTLSIITHANWTNIFLPLYGIIFYISYRQLQRKKVFTSKVGRMLFVLLFIILLFLLKYASVYWECRKHGDFSREKSEIIQRRDYLIDKLVVEPEIVISRMPSGIGQQFQGEWGLYSCSMLSASLVNISMIYPETREYNLERIDSLIKIVNTPCLRKYDTVRWNEDAISSLSSNKSHVSYISHLAWMIGGYKSVGGGNQYDELYDNLCEAMNRRILQSPSLNLETYPGEPIYIPDMLVAIVALKQYSKLNGGKYSSTVQEWVNRARNEWCDDKTGLLSSYLDLNGNKISYAPIKGSYSSLNCSYLTLVDETFAKEQYSLLKKYFWKKGLLSGMKEYYDSTPFFAFDIDAGPIIFGLSPSGTAFSVGATTYFEDSEVRKEILRTAEKAGHTISRNNKKHYALANLALVGEAIMLAMRTNVNTNK